jgi:hypothetical protein
MNYREFIKKLRAIGCREVERRGGGSHRKGLTQLQGEEQPFRIGAKRI